MIYHSNFVYIQFHSYIPPKTFLLYLMNFNQYSFGMSMCSLVPPLDSRAEQTLVLLVPIPQSGKQGIKSEMWDSPRCHAVDLVTRIALPVCKVLLSSSLLCNYYIHILYNIFPTVLFISSYYYYY